MDDVDKIYLKLERIENLYGYTGVTIVLFLLVFGFLLWLFLRSYVNNYAKSIFNQSLAKFQSNLLDDIGQKFINQRGEIEKEITGLKGEIDKEINQINSNQLPRTESLLPKIIVYAHFHLLQYH